MYSMVYFGEYPLHSAIGDMGDNGHPVPPNDDLLYLIELNLISY
jgi:hypothetical protein